MYISGFSALKQPRMFALLFYFSIFIIINFFLVGNSPQTTNKTRFHLDALFFSSLSDAWCHVFSIFCSHVTVKPPSVLVTPTFYIWHWNNSHLPSLQLCSFPARSFLTSFEFVCSHFLWFPPPACSPPPPPPSPVFSYKSLTSIFSLLILLIFLLCWVCLWPFATCN